MRVRNDRRSTVFRSERRVKVEIHSFVSNRVENYEQSMCIFYSRKNLKKYEKQNGRTGTGTVVLVIFRCVSHEIAK